MTKTTSSGSFGFLWLMPVILIFAAGGFLQYVGLLSKTQSNWIALFLLIHVFFRNYGWKQIKNETLLFLFMFFVVIDYFQRGNPISYTLTYLYYIACAIIGAIAGRVYASQIASSISTELFFKIAKYFIFIELVAVLLQKFFTEQFISLARVPIGSIDAIFGTLFLQSDAGLAAVCELLTISSFFLYSRVKDRFIILILSSVVIFTTNSNTAKIAFLVILVYIFFYRFYRKLNRGKYFLNFLLAICVPVFLYVAYISFSGSLDAFGKQAVDQYYHRQSWETASRFSPIGQIFAEGINFFGNGALTYYNPITKEWLYNAGFGTFYCLYIDFGLLGFSLYFFYQVALIIKLTRSYIEFLTFSSLFIFFMFFNFTLTDLAFTFSFNVILNLNYLRGRSSYGLYHGTDLHRKNVQTGIVEPLVTE